MSLAESKVARGYEKHSLGLRAGFWRRWAAAFIDGIILAVVNALAVSAMRGFGELLAYMTSAVYFSLLEGGPTGQTAGKKVMGIRVISLNDGAPIGYRRAFVRFIGRIVSALVIFLGYFWMLWDREKQCWHDKFAGSVVVPIDAYPVRDKYRR